ncbi:MAG: RNA methyltransferase [Alphaproteobacteria bacterium]|nr:RNA methyltransferase [Rickettsiales bacterium]
MVKFNKKNNTKPRKQQKGKSRNAGNGAVLNSGFRFGIKQKKDGSFLPKERLEQVNKKNNGKIKERGYAIYGKNAVHSVLINQSRKIYKILCTEDGFLRIEKIINEQTRELTHILDVKDLDRLIVKEGERRKYDVIVYAGELIEKKPLSWFMVKAAKGKQYDNNTLMNHTQNNQDWQDEKKNIQNLNLDNKIKDNLTFVMLDGVTDLRNVGAIIRSAAAFGVDGVILSKNSAPRINSTVVRASAGYSEEVNIYYVTNLNNTIKEMKKNNFLIFGLDSKGEQNLDSNVFNKDDNAVCLVFGSEGDGIRRLVAKNCTQLYKIPMHKGVESLNIASAASIALYLSYTNRG